MKIVVDNKPVPKFREFTVSVTFQSEHEQDVLQMALRHYAERHARGASDILTLVADAIRRGGKDLSS